MNCTQCGTAVRKEMRFCPSCGTPVRSDEPASGQDARIAALEQALKYKYKIIKKIGAGGFAEVYLGEHAQLGRQVAIKMLLHSFAGEDDMIERFRREAKAAAKLSHPNIIDIYDVGESDGIYFIVMKYIDGETLAKKTRREKNINPNEAISIIKQLAQALAYAHERNIIHRDLKPANVMLDEYAKPILMDFGIARATAQFEGNLTKTGTLMGTPHYLPPEQPLGKPVDGRSDIYSLGILFYEMLAGRPPFHDESSVSLIFKHINEPPPPLIQKVPELVPELCEVVHKMIEKLPENRYQNASEVEEALNSLSAIYPVPTPFGRKSTPGDQRNTDRLLTIARENLQQEKSDKAIEIFATILKRNSSNENARKEIEGFTSGLLEKFHESLATNEFPEARRVLGQLQKMEPKSTRLDPLKSKLEAAEQSHYKESDFRGHFDAARVALEHDNAPGAIEHLTRALTVNPSSPEAQTLLREARASYESNRIKAETANALAEAEYYYNIHSYDMALGAIKKVLDIGNDPGASAMHDRIVAAMKDKDYRLAQKDRIISQVQDFCEQLNFAAAEETLERAKETVPEVVNSRSPVVETYKNLHVRFQHAKELDEQGQGADAARTYEEFLRVNPPYEFRVFYGLRQQAEDALKALREKAASVDVEQQLRKADVFLRMKQYEQARTEVKKILEKDKGNVAALGKLKEIEDHIPETRLQEPPVLSEEMLKEVGSRTVQVPKPPGKTQAAVPAAAKVQREIAATIQPPTYKPAEPEIAAPKSSLPLPVLIGGAAILIVGLFVLFLLLKPSKPSGDGDAQDNTVQTQTDTPSKNITTPQKTVTPSVSPLAVSIDVQPWGKIEISGGGLRERVTDTTPVVIQLPPGTYSVRFENSQFTSFTETIHVDPTRREFAFRFPQFNPDELADSLTK